MADLSVAVEILGKDSGAGSVIDSIGEKLGGLGKFAAIGAGAAVAAIAGIGIAAFKIGEEFDSAFDTIRTTTGATGDALAGLQDDFRAVASSVPGSFDQVSAAVAGLNQRTGQTGPALQALASQMVNLSNVTGTDVATNVGLATRVFGDWSVATEDQSSTLDMLFRASQATGIGVGELQQKVVQFGAPLRAMGFSLVESATLMGKWEKEGVNSELVLGSLRIAMGHFAKDGVPMRQGLQDTIDKITELGPGAQATTLAMETFGARAGPDMAAAILEGRFAMGDLLDTIQNGSETINGAAEDTADFAEKWQVFSNRMKIAFEPAAEAVFGLAGTILDDLAPAIESAIGIITPFTEAFAIFFRTLTTGEDDWGRLTEILDNFFPPDVTDQITVALSSMVEAFDRAKKVISDAWRTVTQVFANDWSPSPEIDQTVNSIGIFATFLRSTVIPAVTQFVGFMIEQFQTMLAFIQSLWDRFGPTILASVQTIINNIQAFWTAHGEEVLRILTVAFAVLQAAVEAAMTVIAGVFTIALQLIAGDWQGAWTTMQTMLQAVWDLITITIIPGALLILQTLLTAGWALIQLGVTTAWDAILLGLTTWWTVTLPTMLNEASAALVLLLNTTWATLQTAATTEWEKLKGIIALAVAGTLTALVTWAGEVIGTLGTLASNALKAAAEIGSNIIKGIVDAVNKGKDDLGDALKNLVEGALNAAKKALGLDHDTGAVTEIGRLLINEIMIGAKSKAGELATSLQGVVNNATAGISVNLPTIGINDVADYIRARAASLGINPQVALAVAASEGGFTPATWVGDHGSSFGPYQLHYGGMAPGGNAVGGMGDTFTQVTGLSAANLNTWQQQVDYALQVAKRSGWGPWHGWTGDPWAGIPHDRGGFLMPGTTLVANNTGRPEPVLTPQQWDRLLEGRGGGPAYEIHVTGIGLEEVADEIMRRIDERELLYGAA